MEPLIKLAIAIGGGIAALWAANKATKVLTGKSLWEHLNEKIRSFCDNVKQWLRTHKPFGAKYIEFAILTLDEIRKGANRVLRAYAVNEKKKVQITDSVLTEEELAELNIKDGARVMVDELC